ncbi:MAG: HAMP domain-containing histidine kinase [Polyangiaceae bacterium]|nr:HAMP domain-containing histidine kinase [Polyangiaceae bacterium]
MNDAGSHAALLKHMRVITKSLCRRLSAVEVAHIVVTGARTAIGADRTAISVALVEDGETLETIATDGSLARRDSHVGFVSERTPAAVEATNVTDYESVARGVFLLEIDGRMLGTLDVEFDDEHFFSAEECAFLHALANVTGCALHHAQQLDSVERAAREIDDAAQLKDAFLSTVSHELRTPLNAILGWSAMLREPLESAAANKGIEVIERNARALARLIDDILDVSRIVRGKLEVKRRTVSVTEIVRAVAAAVRPTAAARGVEFDAPADGDAGVVLGDPDRLQQVVWNLAMNAVKFTPRGGSVAMSAEHDAQMVRIRIADTGAGIEPSFLPHLFERFRQFDSSTTRLHNGLGLGLAISRHLVELHGGTITAESAGAGRGTTFIIELPKLART